MTKRRKRWIHRSTHRQLQLNFRDPRGLSLRLLRSDGVPLLVASAVALAAGVLVHRHLLMMMLPIAFFLFLTAFWTIKRQVKRGGVASPLKRVSLIHGLSTRGYLRRSKYCQGRFDI